MKSNTQSISQLIARQEIDRRKAKGSQVIDQLLDLLSPIQRRMVTDPARFKLARCSRRAGKTFADIVYMLITALEQPNTPVLYVGLTRDSAKGAVWNTMIEILEKFDIGHEALGSGPLLKLANGSYIQLFGADATNARNRLRGRKYKLIIADEMGFFTAADGLIKSMLPMLADYAGTLLMTSSPGERLSGLFYEADQGKESKSWSKYSWNLKDNPHFQGASREDPTKTKWEVELEVMANGLYNGNRNNPSFRREFLGEWVRDNTSLVYPYSEKNLTDTILPLTNPEYAIGVDLGSNSDNAIVVIRYSQYSREVQIVESVKQSNLSVDQLYQLIKIQTDKYNPMFIVADTGGYGAGIVNEFRHRYNDINMIAAEKTDKAFHQRIVATDLMSGYIKCLDTLNIIPEWDKITKDNEGNELKGPPNHASDAFLYIYRKIYNTVLKSHAPKETEEQRMISQLEYAATSEHRDLLDTFNDW